MLGIFASISARAGTIDFESIPSGTNAASLNLPGVAISGGLVLTEAAAALVTGLDSTGWASSGTTGLLSLDAPFVEFTFDVPVGPVSVNALLLPGFDDLGMGVCGALSSAPPGSTVSTGIFNGPFPLTPSWSTDFVLGEDGARFSSIRVYASAAFISCTELPGLAQAGTVFLDDLSFTVPEPSTSALMFLGTALLCGWRRLR